MPQTSREIVKDTLTFNYPLRIPREIIFLSWAIKRYPKAVKEIETRFPNDICGVDYFYPISPRVKGKENEIEVSIVYSFFTWYQDKLYGKNYYGAFKNHYPSSRDAIVSLNPIAWDIVRIKDVSDRIKSILEI
jgi:hypothetical protein